MDKFFSGEGWGLSIIMLLGVAAFAGMLWIAINSDRFKQVVRDEEPFFDEELDD